MRILSLLIVCIVATARVSNAEPVVFRFSKDYFPGTNDAAGRPLVGTEMMNFTAHGGRLYAALGNRNLPDDAKVKEGAQIVVKETAAGPWRVEQQFPLTSPRITSILSATFTTDADGKRLASPVTMLIAAPSDIGEEGDNATDGTGARAAWATAWTRDDATGKWSETEVYSGSNPRPALRSLIVHVDRVTGVSLLFAGSNHGTIYRAAFDPSSPGRLKWHPEPELGGPGRIMAMCECNGRLYAAGGLRRTGNVLNGGLYVRSDGSKASWKLVYQWPLPNRRVRSDEFVIMRGLTAVPAPDGRGEVLLGARSWPGVIERIDPQHDHRVTVELDLKKHFAGVWGLDNYTGASLAAYNQMTPVVLPATKERVHFIGVAVRHPKLGTTPPHNGSWYLIRHADGHYETGFIYDPAHPVAAGVDLRGTRAVVISPFAADANRVLYFGGADIGRRTSLDTAWIYKGTLKEKP